MLSKIDSRSIEDTVVVMGPYSAQYGPGFDFVDVNLLPTPRFGNGREVHGSSSFDYKANGEQWYGRQVVWGGDSLTGYRLGYGHRTGNDYETGGGLEMPSSYNSRDVDFAMGFNITPTSQLEFSYLRLDQTGVEFPGQAFDINWLVTDAFEVVYDSELSGFFDDLELETWHNRTRFEGDNSRAGKRRQFPFYNSIGFDATTDVDSMSAGYRAALEKDVWGGRVTLGSDLRYVKQELNEIASQGSGSATGNSPIPRSHLSNPGIFAEYEERLGGSRLVAGLRYDWVSANVDDDAAKLADIGLRDPDLPFRATLADVLGSGDFDREHDLLMAFLTVDRHLGFGDPEFGHTVTVGGGYAERPPTLTELFAAQPFMFLLQSGLNTVTGNPELLPERRWQVDVGWKYQARFVRTGIRGFHAWVHDLITYENIGVFPNNLPEQVRLKFVNTELATLAGAELYSEADATSWLTVFGTLSYLDGRDRTRNGSFATQPANTGITPSTSVAGLPRGNFSGVLGADAEPLPNLRPLETRIGLRLHAADPEPRWSVELTTRIVSAQNRVASSLLETPTSGFTVWDLRGYWQVSDSLLVTLGVENFTDEDYREYLDFRPLSGGGLATFQPGANFYVGAELTW